MISFDSLSSMRNYNFLSIHFINRICPFSSVTYYDTRRKLSFEKNFSRMKESIVPFLFPHACQFASMFTFIYIYFLTGLH